GQSGNPTIDIASTYVGQNTITTLGTIATGVWNATDIPLSAGGTGASLSDPGADRIMFWDDSDGATEWLEVGSGLSITGNTLSATGGGGVGGLTANRVLVSDGSGDLIAGDVTTTELSILDGATLSTSELNTLDGITASTTELNYTDGVTSNIQSQLNGKIGVTGTSTLTGNVTIQESSNTLTFRSDGLGETEAIGKGLLLQNATAAAAGAQQYSPSLTLEGQGWRTTSTAGSRYVRFHQY